MKTLSLDAYGVQEMSVNEMMSVEGGGTIREALCAIGKALEVVGSAIESFGEWLQGVCCG
jgi:hypothetical protein